MSETAEEKRKIYRDIQNKTRDIRIYLVANPKFLLLLEELKELREKAGKRTKELMEDDYYDEVDNIGKFIRPINNLLETYQTLLEIEKSFDIE